MFGGAQGFVSSDRADGDGLPWLGVLAGRDDGVGAAVGNGVVAFAGVIGRCCITLTFEDSHRESMQLDGLDEQPSPARYRTTNWSSYTASLCKRGSLLIWLDKEMTWLAPPGGSPGRPAVFSDAAIQFCLTIKVLFRLPLRQTTGMVASLLKMADLDWAVPDYITLCRRQKTLAVQIPFAAPKGR